MTTEEHKARAMLMGYKYVAHFGYYRKMNYDTATFHRIDAITLEEIDRHEVNRRQNAMPTKEIWYD